MSSSPLATSQRIGAIESFRPNNAAGTILAARPECIDLGEFGPLGAKEILGGAPQSRRKVVEKSRDWTTETVVWECTAGRFRWHYPQDEMMFVLSGEAFLESENGEERRFGAGDLGFFAAGTLCTWRVPHGIRKVAVMRDSVWVPLVIVSKACRRMLRLVGVKIA